MSSTIYCPYSDEEIPIEESSKEHIVPLSMGGSNQFVIPVSKNLNSTLGSKIDGELANDFLVLFQREKFEAKGHSNRMPAPVVKKAKDADTGRPIQVTFGKQLRIWDAKDRKDIPLCGQKMEVSLQMKIDTPIQFVAKTALAAGYFVYGDLFRKNVRHQDLRLIMNGPHGLTEDEVRSVRTKVFDRFHDTLEESSKEEYDFQRFISESVRGSCVVFMPGKGCLGMFVGILGHYIGMVNVPANTDEFPRFDDHDLGHTIFLIDGVMKRRSYRSRVQEIHDHLTKNEKQS